MASRARILALRLCGDKWCVFPPRVRACARPARCAHLRRPRRDHATDTPPPPSRHSGRSTRARWMRCAARAAEVARRLTAASAGPERYLPRSVARWGERTARSIVDTYESWGEHPAGRGAARASRRRVDARPHPASRDHTRGAPGRVYQRRNRLLRGRRRGRRQESPRRAMRRRRRRRVERTVETSRWRRSPSRCFSPR